MRAAAVMNSLSAKAGATSVEDKPSDSQTALPEFELNITEDPPTQDQLKTILEYVGANKIGSIINGASTEKEALKKFRENSETFQRPVVRYASSLARPPFISRSIVNLPRNRLSIGIMARQSLAITSQRFLRCYNSRPAARSRCSLLSVRTVGIALVSTTQ